MNDQTSEFPGTPLSEEDFEKGNILFLHDEMNGLYSWDAGEAIGRYLEAFKDGIILGGHCNHCRKTVVPPRIVCEWCYRPIQDYVQLLDTGTVNTFSLCYVTWDVKRIQKPEIPAVIEIDGASPLHGIMHKLGDVNPDEVHVGMRVKAVWKKPDERQGAVTDILYFKPMEVS